MPARKTALVTGASSGIGAAIARRLAADGWQVLTAGRDIERTRMLATDASGIRPWVGALATSADADRLVADCLQAFGGLDLLVNNAGIYEIANAESTRSANGEPYRRRDVVLAADPVNSFDTALGTAGGATGVKVVGVTEDQAPFRRRYEPSHPDADADGFAVCTRATIPSTAIAERFWRPLRREPCCRIRSFWMPGLRIF